MSSSSKRYSYSETRKDEHMRLLEKLESIPLSESCCNLCHCACNNNQTIRNADMAERNALPQCGGESSMKFFHVTPKKIGEQKGNCKRLKSNNARNKISDVVAKPSKSTKKFQAIKDKFKEITSGGSYRANAKETPEPEQESLQACRGLIRTTIKRSKSTSSLHSQKSSGASISNMRDCRILQDLLKALNDENTDEWTNQSCQRQTTTDTTHDSHDDVIKIRREDLKRNEQTTPLKLCESLASLCLSPKVHQAFQTISVHDKRILNRMARKRSENATVKENAWLARKYWENERYERELLKCEEMDEYKKAVLDKQFQDYLQTKARLNEMAQRDLLHLQRLRASLEQKDDRSRRRLARVRAERGILQCQRRYDELRKCETVNMRQEEQQIDEGLRKQAICQRLSERLERADQLRAQILETYLKRVRNDNSLEKMLHEEKWRETQKMEQKRREQLKEHISRKRSKSQRFAENKQRRNEVLARTAKLSASLRELVRTSVTSDPETTLITEGLNAVVSENLDRLLPTGSKSKVCTK